MGMFIDDNATNKFIQFYLSIFFELRKGMINDCPSLLGEVITNISDKKEIVDSKLMWEIIFDNSDLLRSEKYSRSIEKQIESMFW